MATLRMNESVVVGIDADSEEEAEARMHEVQEELGLNGTWDGRELYIGHVECRVTTPESDWIAVFHPDLLGRST